jgi:NADPH2:quinone reductase
MRAIQITEFGEQAELRQVDVPQPKPEPGEVLVDVKAAGVNYADLLMCRGTYGGKRPLPFTPGFEAAGVVAAVGDGVTEWKPGDRVMGTVLRQTCACFAEKARMPAWLLLPVPEHMSFEQAGAFMEAFITAQLALHEFGRLQAGETVLIHAAAGGVGTAAVQAAKAAGARVFGTASSDEKLRRVKELGADVLINYAQQDFLEEVKKQTDGKGVDVVLDSVGGEVFEKSLRSMRTLGRVVSFGTSAGKEGTVQPMSLRHHAITLSGFSFGSLSVSSPEIVKRAMGAVGRLLEGRKVHAVVGSVMPLQEAAAAFRLFVNRGNFGKTVLVP